MGKERATEVKKKLTPKQMAQRDTRICKMYSKVKKDGSHKHSIRGIASIIGISKTRVHEIIKEGIPEY